MYKKPVYVDKLYYELQFFSNYFYILTVCLDSIVYEF